MIVALARCTIEAVVAIPLLLFAFIARFVPKKIDIGIGPDPIVSHYYHKSSLESVGYTAETFCLTPFHITSRFDVIASPRGRDGSEPKKLVKYMGCFALVIRSIFRYRALYLYFHGGPLSRMSIWLGVIEPILFKLAKVKILVMPYGSDVQEMSRTTNLHFKHCLSQDYPGAKWRRRTVSRNIDRWTRAANHIVGGCEWVDYMYHWNSLVSVHFPIDVGEWDFVGTNSIGDERPARPLRCIHAPNHREIKGTRFFVDAVKALQEEGYDIELNIIEGVSNEELRRAMRSADLILDQLIIGWYAMFAMEGMSLGKPVVCFLRDDLKRLYRRTGVLPMEELPIINASPDTVRDVLRGLCEDREILKGVGRRSREFVTEYHSLEAMAPIFDAWNRSIGLKPTENP